MNVKELIEVLSKLPAGKVISVDDIANGGTIEADLVTNYDGAILITSSCNTNAATGMSEEEMKNDERTLFYGTSELEE